MSMEPDHERGKPEYVARGTLVQRSRQAQYFGYLVCRTSSRIMIHDATLNAAEHERRWK